MPPKPTKTPVTRPRPTPRPETGTSAGGWWRGLERAEIGWRLLILASVVAAFYASYHLVSMFGHANTISLYTPLDGMIPVLPWTWWFYVPVYSASIVATAMMVPTRGHLLRGCAALGVGQAFNSVCYVLLSSPYPRTEAFEGVETDGIAAIALYWIHRLDPPNNTFPSAHVMLGVICAIMAWRSGSRWRGFPLFAAVGVSISVLTLKQHYVVDVPAGVAVAFIAVAFVDWFVTHRARRRG